MNVYDILSIIIKEIKYLKVMEMLPINIKYHILLT